MRIILSRKGFDSSYGGVASPIFPDGNMLSLPIPYDDPVRKYCNIAFKERPVSEIVESLTQGKLLSNQSCHLDLDLRFESIPRLNGWRPAFGQVGAAQTHLENQGVTVGDLFLFFGWFKQTEWRSNALVYARKARDIHAIFGWLQIAEIRKLSDRLLCQYPWLNAHPHCHPLGWSQNNTVYLSTHRLELPGLRADVAGGGAFNQFNADLQLTRKTGSRSLWSLPSWFYPEGKKSTLSYHSNPARWSRCNGRTELKSVAKGQEFVLDTEHYPEAVDWARQLIEQAF